ncbi:hypothetical protein CBR_g50606 [Chara braunii]|uniref:CCHC-type domain-containing protein n=1 Tax=Chara braunii TaxID=69332 RepID=A0A388M700_CHABU|nr:hypothetical protein CBR_g50606 [Chara braunii]|eukprot:GBG90358.1 hypothetical protein CBR_g50606 [Chara braunii]
MYPPQGTAGTYPANNVGSVHTPAPAAPPPPPPPSPLPPPPPAAVIGPCYSCGEYGHFARDCPYKQNRRNWQGQGRGSYGQGNYGQSAYGQPRRSEEDDWMSRLLAFLENQQLEAAEKKKAKQEKKRQEEEKQRLEEAKLRAEAEKRRAQAIMEATAAQAFAKQMVALEEKIKGHVQSTLTASEEKSAKLHDNLQRFLERVDSEEPKRPRIDAYPSTRRRLELDDYEREADTEGTDAATPVTKKRTVMARKAKEPMVVEEKKKGAVASSSRAGVIEFVLELHESMQTKQAPELKQMCKRSTIRWVSKAQAIKDLVVAETRLAYDGWLTGAESDESKKEDGRSGVDTAPHAN